MQGSDFVLGCAQIGLSYGRNSARPPDAKEAEAILNMASNAGVGQVDTARAYGDSERRIGAFLCNRSEPSVRVITKLSPLDCLADDATLEAVDRGVNKSLEASLEALGLKTIPTLLLHRTAHLDKWSGAVWKRLQDFKRRGLISKLGCSVQNPVELSRALAEPDVEHIQLPINVLDWRWDNTLSKLERRPNVEVHARSVLLQGLLAPAPTHAWPRLTGVNAEKTVDQLRKYADLFRRESIPDLCIAAVRSLTAVNGIVIGIDNSAQLKETLHLFGNPPLDADQQLTLRSNFSKISIDLLDPSQWPKSQS